MRRNKNQITECVSTVILLEFCTTATAAIVATESHIHSVFSRVFIFFSLFCSFTVCIAGCVCGKNVCSFSHSDFGYVCSLFGIRELHFCEWGKTCIALILTHILCTPTEKKREKTLENNGQEYENIAVYECGCISRNILTFNNQPNYRKQYNLNSRKWAHSNIKCTYYYECVSVVISNVLFLVRAFACKYNLSLSPHIWKCTMAIGFMTMAQAKSCNKMVFQAIINFTYFCWIFVSVEGFYWSTAKTSHTYLRKR